jgi:hypothetical protein
MASQHSCRRVRRSKPGAEGALQGLSPAERGASIAAWNNHRRRYGLHTQGLAVPVQPTRSTADERQALLPDGEAVRDAVFLERQGALFQEADRQAAG